MIHKRKPFFINFIAFCYLAEAETLLEKHTSYGESKGRGEDKPGSERSRSTRERERDAENLFLGRERARECELSTLWVLQIWKIQGYGWGKPFVRTKYLDY